MATLVSQWRTTFIQVRAPFAGHPAASSAWLPAAIPSPPGGLESHCNQERHRRQRTLTHAADETSEPERRRVSRRVREQKTLI